MMIKTNRYKYNSARLKKYLQEEDEVVTGVKSDCDAITNGKMETNLENPLKSSAITYNDKPLNDKKKHSCRSEDVTETISVYSRTTRPCFKRWIL